MRVKKTDFLNRLSLRETSFKKAALFTLKKAQELPRKKIIVLDQSLSPLLKDSLKVFTAARHCQESAEEINRLIKKIYLSFIDKKFEAKFLVSGGIFDKAQFSMIITGESLSLEIENASDGAKDLLLGHKDLMKKRLAEHAIHLNHLRFIVPKCAS